MWESRVLCEISKSLWEPLLGFHRDGISIAAFVVARRDRARIQGDGDAVRAPARRSSFRAVAYAVAASRPAASPFGLAAPRGIRTPRPAAA